MTELVGKLIFLKTEDAAVTASSHTSVWSKEHTVEIDCISEYRPRIMTIMDR